MRTYSLKSLPNGLRVITASNPDSPIVTLQLVVRAGSAYELETEYGYAHVLEHMLLKGTKRRPTSYDIGLEIDRIGAYSNAATSHDAAWFILESVSRHTEKLFDVMSDNILNATIDAQVLENEKKVIVGEFRQRDNMLIRKSLVGALNHYTKNHPIARDPLGVESTVLRATSEGLHAYRAKYYVPGNCALIVAGAIDMDRALELAQKYFGSWTGSPLPNLELPLPRFGYGEREFLEHPTDTTYLTLCWGVPRAATLEEYSALTLTTSLLGYGHTSLILSKLRNELGLIYSSGTNVRHHSCATITTIGTSSEKPGDAVVALSSIIQNLGSELTDVVIEEMKNQVSDVFERRMSEPNYVVAFLRELFIQLGDIITPEQYLATKKELKPDFVREVSKTFFDPTHTFTFALGRKPLNQ